MADFHSDPESTLRPSLYSQLELERAEQRGHDKLAAELLERIAQRLLHLATDSLQDTVN